VTEISCTGFAGCPNRVSGLQFPGEDIAASAAGTKRKIHKKEETVGFLLFVRLRQYSPPGKSVPLRGSCAPESECREKPPPVSQPITQFLIPA